MKNDRILLRATAVKKTFALPRSLVGRLRGEPRRIIQALRNVTVEIRGGEILGIVGESGCGKSTLARCLVRLIHVDEGSIEYKGIDVLAKSGAGLRNYNRSVQMIFQDPYSSLNPRMTVGQILGEALRVHQIIPRTEILGRVKELIELVGLFPETVDRYPFEFSGGQRQRIGIARALSVEPECLIADELVSALDVSVQAQIVTLLLNLRERLKLTTMFISHDLRLVHHISHRVAVMYLGSIVETGDTDTLFDQPLHPYTVGLLASSPDLNPRKRTTTAAIRGELPSPLNVPPGCSFHPRCPHVFDRCRVEQPRQIEDFPGRIVACHLQDC